MQEVIARGAKVLLITNKSKDDVVSENIWETIEVESTNEDLLPFLLTIPLQKLAYYSALKKGLDISYIGFRGGLRPPPEPQPTPPAFVRPSLPPRFYYTRVAKLVKKPIKKGGGV